MGEASKSYLLIGAPNVGKSTFYNKITWQNAPVGNVDRVTTLATSSAIRNNKNIKIFDLPGINTLNPNGDDELETFNYLFTHPYDGVLNILNANSLKRDLLLTYQLAEAGVLSMLIVNMVDELKNATIDKLKMTKEFKVIVECISAKKNENVKSAIRPLHANTLSSKGIQILYSDKVEAFIAAFLPNMPAHRLSPRFLIIQALLGNPVVLDFFKKNKILKKFISIKKTLIISDHDINGIYKTHELLVEQLLRKIIVYKPTNDKINSNQKKWSDALLLNKWIAVPLFLLIMLAVYFITFYEYAGGWIQDQFNVYALEGLTGLITDSIINLDATNETQIWWAHLVGDGMMGGIFTILSFIPWLLILITCITILEQIGLLSRMSVVFDRVFAKTGISGRALINLITGFGCNVPAITLTRNASSVKERVVTAILSPFVSCSARVIVYGFIMEGILGTDLSWLGTFGISAFSVVFSVLIGYFFSNLLFRKTNSVFIIELARLRTPDMSVVLKKVFVESYSFVKRTIFVVGICNLVIWLLLWTGPSNQFIINPADEMGIEFSFLRYIAYPFQYLLYPIGLGLEWEFSVSLLVAFPAKEIAASSIDLLFGGLAGFQTAIGVLPSAIAVSYLFFFAFYSPCLAAIVVLKKEIGWKYTAYNVMYGLLFSYLLAMFSFAVFGSIELLIWNVHAIAFSILISIIGLSVIAYIVLIIVRYKRWPLQSIWEIKANTLYNKLFISNTVVLGLTTLCLNAMVLSVIQ